MLRSELAILKLLHHPNVVFLKDIFDTKTHIYIVMEYVQGGELFTFIRDNKKLSEYAAKQIFKVLLDIVSYLNGMGIVHRDIKPENIMIS